MAVSGWWVFVWSCQAEGKGSGSAARCGAGGVCSLQLTCEVIGVRRYSTKEAMVCSGDSKVIIDCLMEELQFKCAFDG